LWKTGNTARLGFGLRSLPISEETQGQAQGRQAERTSKCWIEQDTLLNYQFEKMTLTTEHHSSD
jgi:hypothetical protein